MDIVAEFVGRTFATRNAAQIVHWRTKSYAEHIATGSFYDGLVDALDAFVEAHQGAFGLVDIKTMPEQKKVSKFIDHLEEDLLWIGKNRQKLCGGLPSLDNLIQGIEGLYLSTIYKIKNLA
jgi:hypothetical protein